MGRFISMLGQTHGELIRFVLILLLLPATVLADEREEVAKLAEQWGAESEVVLWDRSRVDLLTETHALEVDHAPKWQQAIGQALYYATVTRRKPGIVLLVRDFDAERKYVFRCQTVCAKYGIYLHVQRAK